ncbi:MAG: ADP-ribose pyrophosphatase, partial [Clostridiaceae bacterium]|nr:ADP-ribose pyrophosphatase [Clostridiaceae bacterium]
RSSDLNDTLEAIIKVVDGDTAGVRRELSESKGIAFDHGKIIEYAVESIRSRPGYEGIGRLTE